MTIIIFAILLFFMVGLVYNYKKFVLLTVIFYPWLYLLLLGGRSLLSYIPLWAVLLYFLRERHRLKVKANQYPFWICVYVILLSSLLTGIYNSKFGFSIVGDLCSIWILPFLCWTCLQSEKHIMYFLKMSFIMCAIAVIYGLYEEVIQYNPINVLFQRYENVYFAHVETRIGANRYGFQQVTSIFSSRDFCGLYCTLYFLFIGYIQNKYQIVEKRLATILMIGLLSIVVLTTARSVYMGFIIGCLLFVNPKTFKSKRFLVVLIVGIFFLPTIVDYLAEVVNSFTSTSSIGGSDSSLRKQQLLFSIDQMMKSPVFGNGVGFTTAMTKLRSNIIYGAESIWFRVMMDYGLIGIVCYVTAFCYPLYFLFKKKLYGCIFLVLSYIVIQSMTSCPAYPYLVLPVIFLKMSDLGFFGAKKK